MAATLPTTPQIEVSTTQPCLEHLPFPAFNPNPNFIYRPFLLSDLDAYNSFSKKPRIGFGQGNPHFDLSITQDRFQRILRDSFSQGIHLGFFLKTEKGDEFELVGEGGVYMPKSSWPYIYWTRLDIERKDVRIYWKRLIPSRIITFWWSLPRKNTRLLVDSVSLLKDSQGRPRPLELLCAHGIHNDELLSQGFQEYEKSHLRSWSNITVSTTIPSLENLPTTSSSRLIYRQLVLDDIEAYHSVRKQANAMRNLGVGRPDPDLDYTRAWFIQEDSLIFERLIGIFLKEDGQKNQEGEMIGYLGVRLWVKGWPHIHYILKEEYWGKKYGSEFLETFIRYWSSLPRKQIHLQVDPSKLDFPVVTQATERLEAYTDQDNLRSQGILRKSGFKKLDTGDKSEYLWVIKIE
jgi:RimJ/RimL family protein N-acetyltransferase